MKTRETIELAVIALVVGVFMFVVYRAALSRVNVRPGACAPLYAMAHTAHDSLLIAVRFPDCTR